MSNPYQSPSQIPGPNYPQYPHGGDSTGGVIPYKNPYALAAYYVGIGSLLCCVFPIPLLTLIPIVLGVIGLIKRGQNPQIKGSAHAWIGIVLGVITTLWTFLFTIFLIVGLIAGG